MIYTRTTVLVTVLVQRLHAAMQLCHLEHSYIDCFKVLAFWLLFLFFLAFWGMASENSLKHFHLFKLIWTVWCFLYLEELDPAPNQQAVQKETITTTMHACACVSLCAAERRLRIQSLPTQTQGQTPSYQSSTLFLSDFTMLFSKVLATNQHASISTTEMHNFTSLYSGSMKNNNEFFNNFYHFAVQSIKPY